MVVEEERNYWMLGAVELGIEVAVVVAVMMEYVVVKVDVEFEVVKHVLQV